jgi:HEAT repeat protein
VVALVSGADAASGDADALASNRVQADYAAALAATSGGRVDAPSLRSHCSKLLTGTGDAVLRARAAEVLAFAADAPTVAQLTDALSSASVDVRRSAALALGRSRHALALPALMTAFELEHELLTRAFLLLAMGDHGGAAAGPFLLEQMNEGKKPLRAWAALGLGLWGRSRDDAATRAAVRNAARGENNHDQDGAWLLALGLLRDRDSLATFTNALSVRDSRTRAAAADALALSGDAGAPAILRTALRNDSCPYVRSALVAALGACGGAADVDQLAESARNDAVPDVRTEAAFALGAMGSEPALEALLALARSADAATRVGALRGLGRIARTVEVPAAAVRTRQANFTLFPDWLGWALSQEQ